MTAVVTNNHNHDTHILDRKRRFIFSFAFFFLCFCAHRSDRLRWMECCLSQQVGVLRWSLTTTDESQMPLTINCWPEAEGGGQMNVNMEYDLVSESRCCDGHGSV